MVEHLVKDPNKLYEICNHRDLEDYYPFSFIGNFNSIEVDIYYDVLNTMDSQTLRNIYGYIVKQWTIIQKHIELSDYSDVSKKKYMRRTLIPHKGLLSKEEFNTILSKFIRNNKVLSLVVMNIIQRYLHP